MWQLDPYASNRDYTAPGGFAREGQLLNALDGTFVTPQALPDYADGAPLAPWREKVHVLGFPTLLPRVMEPVEHDDIQCVFCGSLHPGMREPGFALALFRALHDDAVTLTMAGGGWERFEADADETARVLGAKFVRPGLLPPDEAAALENRADVLVSLGNTYDNQMPSKLFGYFATGKPVLHLAVSETTPPCPIWRATRWRWFCTGRTVSRRAPWQSCTAGCTMYRVMPCPLPRRQGSTPSSPRRKSRRSF